jgi:hypothetical protein
MWNLVVFALDLMSACEGEHMIFLTIKLLKHSCIHHFNLDPQTLLDVIHKLRQTFLMLLLSVTIIEFF